MIKQIFTLSNFLDLAIREWDLDSVLVFKAPLSQVNEAIQWCTKSKSSSSTVASKCSTNACNTMDRLKTCARCNYAMYCSKEHQISDWKRHKMICSDMPTIVRLVECISKRFRGSLISIFVKTIAFILITMMRMMMIIFSFQINFQSIHTIAITGLRIYFLIK